MNLQKLLNGYFEDNVRSYSGRGMYGRNCLAVEVDSLGVFMEGLGQLLADNADDEDVVCEVARLLGDVRTDSMGLGIVVYFPRFLFEGGEEERD